MASTLRQSRSSDPVRDLENFRPEAIKAGRYPTSQSDPVGSADSLGPAIGEVAAEAVVAHYGSVKAAAIDLKNVDPTLMMRELRAGKLGRLDDADDQTVKAAVFQALHKAFPASDPKARALQIVRDCQRRLEQLAEVVNG